MISYYNFSSFTIDFFSKFERKSKQKQKQKQKEEENKNISLNGYYRIAYVLNRLACWAWRALFTFLSLNWIEDEVTVYVSSVAHNGMLSEVTKWE